MRGLCSWPALSRKKLIRKLFSGKTLSLCVFLNFRHLTKYFPQIYGSPYVAAMLVHFHGTPTWRPENGVSIWNLLWLSRRQIVCTEYTNIYINTFPNAFTSQMTKKYRDNYIFFAKHDLSLCHAPPQLWNSKCAGFQTKRAVEPVELKDCETSSSCRVFYLMKLTPQMER